MNDDTTLLRFVAATPAQITETSEETEAAALVADLSDHLAGILRLIGSRADAGARAALHEEIVRLVADAQQLDAHLAEADRITDAGHDAAFADWLTAPGGDQR
jgi:hypothetical protein